MNKYEILFETKNKFERVSILAESKREAETQFLRFYGSGDELIITIKIVRRGIKL